jgi:PilZ domain
MSLSTSVDNGQSFSGIEARRSTRINSPVRLLIEAKNKMGQSFQEKTSVVSLNLHGCRYRSRHDYSIGMWVTLRLTEPREAESAVLRAQVRSVRAPKNPNELYQIGVELESPANVWGIPAPPSDWERTFEATAFLKVRRDSDLPTPLPTASTAEREPAAAATTPTPAEQVLPTQFIPILQKAVRTAVAKQLDESLKDALWKFNEVSRAKMQQAEESLERRIEMIVYTSRAEVVSRLDSRLAEDQQRWKEQQDAYRSRTEEIAGGLEKLGADTRRDLAETKTFVERAAGELEPRVRDQITASVERASQEFEAAVARVSDHQLAQLAESALTVTREASLQLEARAAEARLLMESAATRLQEWQRQMDAQFKIVSEANERIISSVAALDAENRVVCQERIRKLEDDLARAADRSTEQFRNGLNSLLSSLVGTVSAGEERTESTLHRPESSTRSSE